MKNLAKIILVLTLLAACSPTVKVEAPDKPIEINLNINIEHNVKIQIDKQLDELMEDEDDIF